jgi:hypothetical protein
MVDEMKATLFIGSLGIEKPHANARRSLAYLVIESLLGQYAKEQSHVRTGSGDTRRTFD